LKAKLDKAWAGTTYGNGWMHKWLIRMLRWMDVRLLYAFSAIFIVPVCLILNESRGIIYRYFRERLGYAPMKAAWKTYVNHCQFSQVVIDKFAMYAGKKFDVEVEGYEHFLHLAKQKDGFIQLSSHIGNYEIAGYTLVAEDKPFNALVFFGEKQSVMQNRRQMFADTNIRMIPVSSDMSHLFEIDHALQNGETVSMPADRIFGSPKAIEAEFLGAKAKFPQGPFSVATMRGLEVLAVNGGEFLRYDGTAKVVKDDALLQKVREAMPQIRALYDKNGWEMGLFCLENGHAEIRGMLDLKEEFDV
jgi:predicted LPLAT superfamily acyltransferase